MAIESFSLVAFAFSAGALTFFAPCAYPLLPGYVAYYLEDTTDGTTPNGGPPVGGGVLRAVAVGLLVSSGFFLVYGVLAGVVVALGARVLSGIGVLELVVGVVLVALGGPMAVGWTPPTPTIPLPERRRSAAGYVGFGVLYAAAAAGCTAPLFIAVALEALSAGGGFGVLTLLAYAAGMSALMVGVTVTVAVSSTTVLEWFDERMALIHRAAGVLLLLAGLFEIYFFLFRFRGLELLGV